LALPSLSKIRQDRQELYPVALPFNFELAWSPLSKAVVDLFRKGDFALVTAVPIATSNPFAVL
jgi:hypothetical protein